MATKLSSPFPDISIAFVDAQGRLNRVWAEFLLTQFRRSGGSAGGDLAALQREVAEIEQHLGVIDGEVSDAGLLIESNAPGAMLIAVFGRLAALEMMVASQPSAPAQRVQTTLPEPVAPLARAVQSLPDPVAPITRPANDDLRKLIEAQT
jgi:hypothetical protein